MGARTPGHRLGSKNRRVAVALGVAGMTVLSGCAVWGLDSEAGFGLPTLDEEEAAATLESGGAEPASTTGELDVESNGCFTWRSGDDGETPLDGAWIVWPDGSRQDGDEVVLSSGGRVGAGDALDATAARVALDDLPAGSSDDSYFGSFGMFCDAQNRGVAVLTEVAPG